MRLSIGPTIIEWFAPDRFSNSVRNADTLKGFRVQGIRTSLMQL
jgi:hypothetical protein